MNNTLLLQQFDLLATAPGGVARLRELILTLAVRGQLVPQDPADEPASALLKRIRAEKDRLIAEGKIKRDKPLAPIGEDGEPFGLPSGWAWVRLGSVTNYGSPTKAGVMHPQTWVLDMEDIEKNSGRLLQRLRYAERPAISEKNSFAKGDVLYGKLRPYLNKVLVADEDGVCTTEVVPFRCYSDYVPQFFQLALSSPFFLAYVNARSYGMKMPRLGTEDARNAVIPLPPLPEQARIVARVEELMRVCDALEATGQRQAAHHRQLVQTLLGDLTADSRTSWQRVATHFDTLLDRPSAVDALEQTILQLAVRGQLVPQDPTDEPASALLKRIRAEKDRLIAAGKIKRDKPLAPIGEDEQPFELPPGWEWVRWANIAMKIGDIDHKMPSEAKNGVPYVSPRDFYGTNEIDFDGAKKIAYSDYVELASKIRPEAGDLIYPRYGTIGVVRKVTTDREFLASYSCAVIKVLRGFVESDYQYLFSVSECAKAQAASATNKTTQPNVGLKSIQEFLVPLPPLPEQARIVARVAQLRRLCADLHQRLTQSQTALAEALAAAVA